jgi:lipopolysaccharide/colanic/teichoic acid biosynthesis glycosyltransferase
VGTALRATSFTTAAPRIRRRRAQAARSGVATDVPTEIPADRVRRLLNVSVAAVGLIVALPLMVAIAVAVRLSSKGPVIYSQIRVGWDRRRPGVPSGNFRRERDLGGKPFRIYKFRTMRTEPVDVQMWASPDDPRVTPVGRVLRKFRLDELPQLVNVLRGEMNIVGPRPEQPEIFARLRDRIDDYEVRQRVLPGITGWAQVRHRYDASEDDVRTKLAFDLEYVSRRSTMEDFRIMCMTVPVMVLQRGAW